LGSTSSKFHKPRTLLSAIPVLFFEVAFLFVGSRFHYSRYFLKICTNSFD
jgi:hypothetical protein